MRTVIKVSPECVPGLAPPQQLPVCVGAGGLQAGVKLVVVNTGCNRAPVLRGGSYRVLYRVFVIQGVCYTGCYTTAGCSKHTLHNYGTCLLRWLFMVLHSVLE